MNVADIKATNNSKILEMYSFLARVGHVMDFAALIIYLARSPFGLCAVRLELQSFFSLSFTCSAAGQAYFLKHCALAFLPTPGKFSSPGCVSLTLESLSIKGWACFCGGVALSVIFSFPVLCEYFAFTLW